MNKRRILIFVLFFAIAVLATSRTLLLSRDIQEEQIQVEETVRPPQRPWDSLLKHLIVLSVSLPFFITAFVLVCYTIRDE